MFSIERLARLRCKRAIFLRSLQKKRGFAESILSYLLELVMLNSLAGA